MQALAPFIGRRYVDFKRDGAERRFLERRLTELAGATGP
jgi:hypothetical protein